MKSENKRYQLRKIVGSQPVKVSQDLDGKPTYLLAEILECGHTQFPKRDIYGETNAVRRRCRQCFKRS